MWPRQVKEVISEFLFTPSGEKESCHSTRLTVQEMQVDIYLSWTWVTVSHVTCQLPGSLGPCVPELASTRQQQLGSAGPA